TSVPPVIDAESAARIREIVARTRDRVSGFGNRVSGEGKAGAAGPETRNPKPETRFFETEVAQLAQHGHFVGPTVFTDVDERAEIAQQEIFGPVLAVIRAKNLSDALR